MEKTTAIDALAALAQETRLDVFRLLVGAGVNGMAAGAISDRLEIPAATMSFHLKELRRAGLIHSRRDGRSLIYTADFHTMQRLLGYLTEHCCQGPDALDIPGPDSTRHARTRILEGADR